ncbi:hypothetical protein LGKMAHEF_04103 [Aeromonas salmonicida]
MIKTTSNSSRKELPRSQAFSELLSSSPQLSCRTTSASTRHSAPDRGFILAMSQLRVACDAPAPHVDSP